MWSGLLSGASEALAKAAQATQQATTSLTSGNIVDKVKTSAAAEHEQFLREKEKYSGPDDAVEQDTSLPWEFSRADLGTEVSDEARERVLKLSTDDRTFTTPVPDDVGFVFDFERRVDVAMRLLELDAKLANARFRLVPRKVDEPTFWKRYFFRTNLIRQSYLMDGDDDDAGAQRAPAAGAADGGAGGAGRGDVAAAVTAGSSTPVAAEPPPPPGGADGAAVDGSDGATETTAETADGAGSAPEAAGDDADGALEEDLDGFDPLDVADDGDFEAALEQAMADDGDDDLDAADGIDDDELEARIRAELGEA